MVCNQKEERKSVQAFSYDALFKKDERVVKVFVWEETKHDTHYIDCVWNIKEYDYIRKRMKNVLHVACFLLWKLLNNSGYIIVCIKNSQSSFQISMFEEQSCVVWGNESQKLFIEV